MTSKVRQKIISAGPLVVPARLGEMMEDADPAKARRVAKAILKMVQLDIAGLEAALAGR